MCNLERFKLVLNSWCIMTFLILKQVPEKSDQTFEFCVFSYIFHFRYPQKVIFLWVQHKYNQFLRNLIFIKKWKPNKTVSKMEEFMNLFLLVSKIIQCKMDYLFWFFYETNYSLLPIIVIQIIRKNFAGAD